MGRREQTRPLELVQVFRGAAALLVMLYHLTMTNKFHPQYMNSLFGFGHCGVDFFFILSGFVMLYAHYDQAGQIGRAPRFLLMRAARIYPIYWCVLAVTVLMFWLFPPGPQNFWAPRSTLEPATLVSSVLLTDPRRPIVSVAWTLTYELLFYAFFALYFVCGRRLFAALSAAWCAAIAAEWAGVVSWPYPILLRPIVGEFFLGCVAAVLIKRLDWKHLSGWWVLGAAALCAAVARAEMVGAIDPYKWYAVPFFLLIWTGAAYDHATHRTYPRALVLLGEASYVIYLFHYGMIALFSETVDYYRDVASLAPALTLTVVAVVIVVVGVAVHMTIEKPLLRLARSGLRSERGAARRGVAAPFSAGVQRRSRKAATCSGDADAHPYYSV